MKIRPVSVAEGPVQQSRECEHVLSWKDTLYEAKQKGRWSKESTSSGYSTANSEDESSAARNGAYCADSDGDNGRHYAETDEESHVYAGIDKENNTRHHGVTDEEDNHRFYSDTDEDNYIIYADTDKQHNCRHNANIDQEENAIAYADTYQVDCARNTDEEDNVRVYTDEENSRVYAETDEVNGRVYADSFEDNGRVYTGTDEDNGRVYADSDEDNGRVYADTDEDNGRFYGGSDENNGRAYADTDEDNGRQYVTAHENSDRNNDNLHKNSHSSKKKAYTNSNQRSTHKPNSNQRYKPNNSENLLSERQHFRYNQKVGPRSKSYRSVIRNDEGSADEQYSVSGFSNESRSDDEVSAHTRFSTCTTLKNNENRGSEGKTHCERKEVNTDDKPRLVPRSPMVESASDMNGEEEAAGDVPEAGPRAAGPYQMVIEQRIQSAGYRHHRWLYDAENLWTYLRQVDQNGDTHLMYCCCHDTHLAACYYLVQRSLDYDLDINHKNNLGETALWNAAFYNQPDLVGYLMECGADPTVNIRGESIVRRCVRKGYTKVVEVLLTAQSSFQVDMKRGNDHKDCSLLCTAAEFQQSEVIKLLVEKLLAKNDTDCLFENLTETIRNNWLERLQYILEHVPNSQSLTTLSHTYTKMTLMHEVALHDDLDVATKKTFFEILEQHGADANSKDICDLTPTHYFLKTTN